MNRLSVISRAQQALAEATTPQETKAVEAMAQAARAWAKEQKDYETLIVATHIYIMARRKTTELILPYITHGGNNQGNKAVTLSDYNLTRMQWNRRVMELEYKPEEIDTYFDECIAKHWEPSLFGMLKYNRNDPPAVQHAEWCNTNKPCNCGVKNERA